MDRCPNCHQQLPQSAERFCVYCGAEIPVRPRRSVAMLVTICAVALALVAGVAIYFALRPGNPRPVAASVPVVPTTAPPAGARRSTTPPPSQTSTTTTTPTTTTTTTSTSSVAPTDPAGVVTAFYDAINARDFDTAWDLGGKNFGHSFTEFASGFNNTQHDDLTITSVNGNTVQVSVIASESGGVTSTYSGSYTVQGGEITKGTMKKTG